MNTQRVALRDVVADARSGFACGARAADGIAQVRMNNVTTGGSWDWSVITRIPVDLRTVGSYLLRTGDVLFNNTNSMELVGKSAIFTGFPEPIVFSNHFTRLRTSPELDPFYLAHWLVAQWQAGVFLRLCDRWVGQAAVRSDKLLALTLPLPDVQEQRRIAARLTAQLATIENARVALAAQADGSKALAESVLRESLTEPVTVTRLRDALVETTGRVGLAWTSYPLIGATRAGLAPAKEAIGRSPEKYKLADKGTIFYNPMRILLGSIAHVDEERDAGITSPDYVVFHTDPCQIDDRWFYAWLRSWRGEGLIRTLARGAVRERVLFRRLAAAEIQVPSIHSQTRAAAALRAASAMTRRIGAEQSGLEALAPALVGRAFADDGAALRNRMTGAQET